jgi:hypothetical protein
MALFFSRNNIVLFARNRVSFSTRLFQGGLDEEIESKKKVTMCTCKEKIG